MPWRLSRQKVIVVNAHNQEKGIAKRKIERTLVADRKKS